MQNFAALGGLDGVRRRLNEMDPLKLASLVRIGVAEVNRDRGMLQVVGCGASVVAQVRVEPIQLAQIERIVTLLAGE